MTLHQLRTVYSLADLCDMHEAMRAWDEEQEAAHRAQEAEANRGRNR